MSTKVKLISFISAFVLVLGIMIIGVLSAEQVQVNIGGSVSFNATNVYAKVSGNISEAKTGNKIFSTLTYSASETTGDESDWTNLVLEFTETPDPIIITITVENLSTQRTLTANLENTLQGEGLDIAVTRDSGIYTSGTNVELPVSTGDGSSTTTFTLTLTVADPNQDLTGVNFGYILNLYDENYAPDQPYQRVDAEGNPDENGRYILFGWYPQTVKANDVTIVNETQPEANGYYLGSDGSYYMRATAAVNSDLESGCANFSNGTAITQGTEYYFKMEQLKWRILTEDYNDTGNALIVCDTIVDMLPYQSNYVYQNAYYYATDEDGTILTDETATVGQGVDSQYRVYANNYEYSEIRYYLNSTFYNTAFSDEEKSYIVTTTVDNSLESIFGSYTSESGYTEDTFNYECRDTQDNVFLLSLSDVNNIKYGFKDSYEAIVANDGTQPTDSARYYYTSDYSKAMGAATITQEMLDAHFGGIPELFGEGIIGSGNGWLRSPSDDRDGRYAYYVVNGGYVDNSVFPDGVGVVPALQIKL